MSSTFTVEVEASRSLMDGREAGTCLHRKRAISHPGRRSRNDSVRFKRGEVARISSLYRSKKAILISGESEMEMRETSRGSRTTETVGRSDDGQLERWVITESK
jgi:hypothetical protein